MNSTGLDWIRVRGNIQKSMDDCGYTAQDIHDQTQGKASVRAIGDFLSGKTSYLSEPVLGAAAEALFLEREDLMALPKSAIPPDRVKPHHPNSPSTRAMHKRTQERIFSKKPVLKYIRLDSENSQNLGKEVHTRLKNSGYRITDICRDIELAERPLNNLLYHPHYFDKKLQDKFLDLCAFLNENDPCPSPTAEAYMRKLLSDAGVQSSLAVAETLVAIHTLQKNDLAI